jgi:hypothetical protein
MLDILHLIFLHSNTTQEALEASSTSLRALINRLEADIIATDTDLTAATTHINVLPKCLAVLESNLDMARQILGTDLNIDISNDGLEMDDDVEMFWNDEAESSDTGLEDEEIDAGHSDELVDAWLDKVWWPGECENA